MPGFQLHPSEPGSKPSLGDWQYVAVARCFALLEQQTALLNTPTANHINEKGLSPDKPFVVNALGLDHQKPRHDQPCNGHHAENKQYPAGAGIFTVVDQLLGLQMQVGWRGAQFERALYAQDIANPGAGLGTEVVP